MMMHDTPVIRPEWIEDCFAQNDVLPLESYYIRPLEGLVISLTGFTAEKRDEIEQLVKDNGGVFMPHLDKTCTHLIAESLQGKKCEAAMRWKSVHIMRLEWIQECIKRHRFVPEDDTSGGDFTIVLASGKGAVPAGDPVRLAKIANKTRPVAGMMSGTQIAPTQPHVALDATEFRFDSNAFPTVHLESRDAVALVGGEEEKASATDSKPAPPTPITTESSTETRTSGPSVVSSTTTTATGSNEYADMISNFIQITSRRAPIDFGVSAHALPKTNRKIATTRVSRKALQAEEGVFTQLPSASTTSSRTNWRSVSPTHRDFSASICTTSDDADPPGGFSGDSSNDGHINTDDNSVHSAHRDLSSSDSKDGMDFDEKFPVSQVVRYDHGQFSLGDGGRSGKGKGASQTTSTTTQSLNSPIPQQQQIPKLFVLSGIPDQNMRAQYISSIKSLGGLVSEGSSFDANCTHLITLQPSRTEKFLAAVVSKKWVLHPDYIVDSVHRQAWAPEENFEWTVSLATKVKGKLDETTSELCAALERCKHASGKCYEGWDVVLSVQPSFFNGFKHILIAGGAHVRSFEELTETEGITHVFVDSTALKQFRGKIEQLYDADPSIKILNTDYCVRFLTDPDVPLSKFIQYPNDTTTRGSDAAESSVAKRPRSDLDTSRSSKRRP